MASRSAMTSWTVGSAASLSRPPNGVCAILFGDDDNTLIADLATRYPEANRESAEAGSDFRRWVERTLALIDLPTSAPALPLDVAGTAFQETVWRALQEIPPGRTDTYSEVAARIGKPDASRAVAGACAANPAAVAIPCHRVVRSANGRQLDLCPTGSSKSPRVPDTSSRSADVIQVRGVEQTRATDCIAAEEPLEVRLHGRSFAVIMRTPGADRELAAGFLFAERVIRVADDLGTIKYCTDPAAEHPENVVNVTLVGGSLATVERMLSDRRQVTTNSSCGLCGRLSIESLRTEGAPLDASWSIDRAVVCSFARPAARGAAHVRHDRRSARRGTVHRGRPSRRSGRGRRPPQRGGQGDRPDAHARGAPPVRPGALRQRPGRRSRSRRRRFWPGFPCWPRCQRPRRSP